MKHGGLVTETDLLQVRGDSRWWGFQPLVTYTSRSAGVTLSICIQPPYAGMFVSGALRVRGGARGRDTRTGAEDRPALLS
ncbi:hypothetical protein EYF80_011920 [Liparis tanakae]|uniref:Uncharacterized protein n=1 Tax=Liparis tanakae TaxID=230148 RepID=A0A4Z2IL00_9TELE|nr:hypothetical protein EYF80_011920 [Liparis tanakae]